MLRHEEPTFRFVVSPPCRHGPPADERLVGWEDVLLAERQSWNATGTTEELVLSGQRRLTFAEKIQQRLFEARKIPHFQFALHQPRGRPALWIVRPKQGKSICTYSSFPQEEDAAAVVADTTRTEDGCIRAYSLGSVEVFRCVSMRALFQHAMATKRKKEGGRLAQLLLAWHVALLCSRDEGEA